MAKKINQGLDKLAFRTGTQRGGDLPCRSQARCLRLLFQDKTFVFPNRIMFNRDTDEQSEDDSLESVFVTHTSQVGPGGSSQVQFQEQANSHPSIIHGKVFEM